MAIHKLKPLGISKLKPGTYSDGGGLYLRVDNNKGNYWYFRYMIKGVAREMGLGAVDLKRARSLAADARELKNDGVDPLEDRRAKEKARALEEAKSLTFDECAAQYIASHSSGWSNKKHASQWANTLKTYASPIIGHISMQDVDTNLVVQVLEPIWHTKTETASRIRMRMESILDWAKVRGYRDGENPALWRGHLDKIFPGRTKVQKVKSHAAMDYEELPAFMVELRKREGISSFALEFTILTAARTGEVIGTKWDEIDFQKQLWTVPQERMKTRKPHTVPLSPRVIVILKQLLDYRLNDYVFPGQKPNKGISNMTMNKALERMKVNATVHGFRSTFRDWVAERTNTPSWVAEKALSHAVADKVEAAYRRGDLLLKRQALMESWDNYCSSKPGDIVSISAATSNQ